MRIHGERLAVRSGFGIHCDGCDRVDMYGVHAGCLALPNGLGMTVMVNMV